VSGGRGRPFQPGNKFGKGRPRGSRNKVNAKAKEILLDRSESLARKCVVLALKGDTKALQMCLDRVIPVRGDQPVVIGSLPLSTAADIVKASEIVTQKAATGRISVEQAAAFAGMLELRRRSFETLELASRVSSLEQTRPGEARA
jgi:hypothetical protein